MSESTRDKAIRARGIMSQHETRTAAAEAMGVSRQLFSYYLRVHNEMVLSGDVPEINLHEKIPSPMQLSGVSYLLKTGATDNPVLQWVKTKVKTVPDTADLMEFASQVNAYTPAYSSKPWVTTDDQLLTQYTITDLHVGMYSWHEETGNDWDLHICTKTVLNAMTDLTWRSPNSKIALLLQNGDFFHYDSNTPVTPTNNHNLSADGRFLKMYRTGVQIMIESITMLLAKHEQVQVVIGRGNHDIITSQVLRETIRAVYANEPRVEVIGGANPFYCITHGQCMIAAHHGDLKKKINLPAHFASHFAKEWGNSRHRYIHTGHFHQLSVNDVQGCTVYQHPTIAAADDYAAHKFDKTKREMAAITYHEDKGIYLIVNHTVGE